MTNEAFLVLLTCTVENVFQSNLFHPSLTRLVGFNVNLVATPSFSNKGIAVKGS